MIAFDRGDARFNYRVVGVCVHERSVLVQREESENFWSLPGGRGEIGETSPDSLRREMREELGVDVAVERLLWVVENFFPYANRNFHELALYHLMSLPDNSEYLAKNRTHAGKEEHPKLTFRWFSLQELTDVRLFPSFLRVALGHLPDVIEHVIHTDIDQLQGRL